MAQVGFILSDEGRTITGINDSGTTAIVAGDTLYSIANDDMVTGTAASVRAAYAYSDIKVKAVRCSATGYLYPIGIALQDCPADGQLAIALEGIFMHPVNSNTEAGDVVMFDASTSSKVDLLPRAYAGSTSTTVKVGRALTGGTADGKYIIWKLSL